jgi:signal transduction histidine kinase
MSLDTETHHRIDVLERELAQKNVELQGLLERIRELDAVNNQFFANVSHALRTPLGLILGPAQRLVDDDGTTLDPAQRRDNAQIITRNARLLLKQVNDLLDMAQLEAGKLKLEIRHTDVAALLRRLGEDFAPLAAERNIDYAIDVPAYRCVAADPDKLQRVVLNLLGNAFKFTPRDGRVRCTLQPLPGGLRIVVEDSGPGVPPHLREAIFERFRQVDGGARASAGTCDRTGTGLGLAIAKEFVDMHKGRIAVRDSPLGGARFEVVIPQHAPAANAPDIAQEPMLDRTMVDGVLEDLRFARPLRPQRPADADAAPVLDRGRARVLVIEDNPDMNRFVSQCLAADYDVYSAFDGDEALETALRVRPTLIVTDVLTPTRSGVDMIDEMRKRPELALVPILLLSDKADEPLMMRLLDDGAQDYIVEPFAQKDLLVRVRNLVLAQQAREQIDGLRLAAESATRAKDEFLAMLGHELRNPLSPILTAVQLMKVHGPSADRARTIIERQVNHLIHLVDDLMDVARIARGQMELNRQPMELSEAVGRAIENASPMIDQRAHALIVEVPRLGLPLHADAPRLAQVITNLLTNAAKYTPPGGRIDVAAWADGRDVVLSVRDSGIGISPAVLPHIFDRFVQMPQTIDRSLGGLGLGLTIVRHLVERHGGSVQARSDGENRGSEFIVRLPRAAGEESAQAAGGLAAPQPHAGPAKMRVLVVDDNEDGAAMLCTALQLHGYEVRAASDGMEALRVAAEFRPEAALLDIGLPVMDGYELAGRLRNMPALAGIRLIALTGYGQDRDRAKAHAAGFDHHLVKPVAVDALEGAMRG